MESLMHSVINMDPELIEPGELHLLELVALELEIRKAILDFIGFELKGVREIGEEFGLNDQELKDHLCLLERGLLVEQTEGCYRATPRCIGYLNENRGYEWRR